MAQSLETPKPPLDFPRFQSEMGYFLDARPDEPEITRDKLDRFRESAHVWLGSLIGNNPVVQHAAVQFTHDLEEARRAKYPKPAILDKELLAFGRGHIPELTPAVNHQELEKSDREVVWNLLRRIHDSATPEEVALQVDTYFELFEALAPETANIGPSLSAMITVAGEDQQAQITTLLEKLSAKKNIGNYILELSGIDTVAHMQEDLTPGLLHLYSKFYKLNESQTKELGAFFVRVQRTRRSPMSTTGFIQRLHERDHTSQATESTLHPTNVPHYHARTVQITGGMV